VHSEEKMVLSHEPVAGYRTALYVAIAVGLIYLGIAFLL
jgi:hypothetical protein